MDKKAKTAYSRTIVLLDSHAIIHRAYHALPDFASKSGVPTGALYGLSTMLIRIIGDLKPDYVFACYDLPEKTFRHEAYEGYKAGRTKTDDALVAQLISSREIFDAFNIPIYDRPGYEADDVIGTLASRFSEDKENKIIIASGDMDTIQLVSGTQVSVFTLKKGLNDTVIYDEDAVRARFGFGPEHIADYKGLRGDPSDNIPGIRGIGEKTATELILSFGSVEDMYKALKKDKAVFKERGFSDRIIKLVEEGEEEAIFSKTLARIKCDIPLDLSLPEKTWKESFDLEKVKAVFEKFEFRTLLDRVVRLIGSGEVNASISAPREEISIDDTQASRLTTLYWLLNPDETNPPLEKVRSHYKYAPIEDIEKKLLGEIKETGLSFVWEEIEEPLIPILKKMQMYGVVVDKDFLGELSKKYHATLSGIERDIWDLAGMEFNINSPKQLSEVLFDTLNLSVKGVKKNATGGRSTRVTELEKLQGSHPIIDKIMEYRELQKLLSTYIDVLPSLVAEDGRIHTEFIAAGTTTGRFSSARPNLQNIPIKTELGKAVRQAFIAPKNSSLVSFDYSQIELRIAAIIAGDEFMMDVFRKGEDIHTSVASRVFNVPPSEVTYEMRRRAKVINFGVLYGMGILALKQNLKTDKKEAEEFYLGYFAQFPKIAEYIEVTKQYAYTHGYTKTLLGRRRPFPDIRSKIPYIRANAERMAVNAPIQGTEADGIKLAIVRIDRFLKEEDLEGKVHLILQVHDELVYEIDDSVRDAVIPNLRSIMENCFTGTAAEPLITIPITVDVSIGKNWAEL